MLSSSWRVAGRSSSFFRVSTASTSSRPPPTRASKPMPSFSLLSKLSITWINGRSSRGVSCISITLAFSRMSHHCQSVWYDVGKSANTGSSAWIRQPMVIGAQANMIGFQKWLWKVDLRPLTLPGAGVKTTFSRRPDTISPGRRTPSYRARRRPTASATDCAGRPRCPSCCRSPRRRSDARSFSALPPPCSGDRELPDRENAIDADGLRFQRSLATVFPALSVIDQRIFAFRRAEPLKLYTSAFAVKVSSQNHALFG